MPDGPAFRPGLYRGLAEDYDRYRPGYPAALITELGRLAPADRSGRLLDLACGTGQLAFALAGWFAEVWAVDAEPDMIRLVTDKADHRIRPVLAAAEELAAPAAGFDLVTVGNAFHRLRRAEVAARTLGWLRPAGQLALCWADLPWLGEAGWQQACAATLRRWSALLDTADRVPAGWHERRPDAEVLAAAGFELRGRIEFTEQQAWTVADLAGLAGSTSVLPRPVLGDRAAEFQAELADQLGPFLVSGRVTGSVRAAVDLARRPSTWPAGRDAPGGGPRRTGRPGPLP